MGCSLNAMSTHLATANRLVAGRNDTELGLFADNHPRDAAGPGKPAWRAGLFQVTGERRRAQGQEGEAYSDFRPTRSPNSRGGCARGRTSQQLPGIGAALNAAVRPGTQPKLPANNTLKRRIQAVRLPERRRSWPGCKARAVMPDDPHANRRRTGHIGTASRNK